MSEAMEMAVAGEVRSISHLDQRLSEVQRLGFSSCMIPAHRSGELKSHSGLKLFPVENIGQALRLLAQEK